MKSRIWIRGVVAILVLCTVFAVSRWAVFAQAQTPQTAPPTTTIISGADVGFRVDIRDYRGTGKPHGQWVVRVNGEWVVPDTTTTSRLTLK
jgi:hypothetical protein